MLDQALALGALLGVVWGLCCSSLGGFIGDLIGDGISRTPWGRALDKRIEARIARIRSGGAA
jgi:uncharacterized membrane protein YdjX (TVP38/TMEM64 family)